MIRPTVCHKLSCATPARCVAQCIKRWPLFLQNAKVHILDTESFDTTFGPKAQRKRPNIRVADMDVSVQMVIDGRVYMCSHGCRW